MSPKKSSEKRSEKPDSASSLPTAGDLNVPCSPQSDDAPAADFSLAAEPHLPTNAGDGVSAPHDNWRWPGYVEYLKNFPRTRQDSDAAPDSFEEWAKHVRLPNTAGPGDTPPESDVPPIGTEEYRLYMLRQQEQGGA